MGMADLKRTCSKPFKLEAVDVQDFIDDAENYVNGLPSLIFNAQKSLSVTTVTEPLAEDVIKRRNATFSLNEKVVDTLSELSENQHLPKSKLVRAIIAHFAQLPEFEQKRILKMFAD